MCLFWSVVPIYDGRHETGEPFRFTDENFSRLWDWRVFCSRKGERIEIPVDSVVAIGGTVGTFNNRQFLSTNVQFVIVINTPGAGGQ